MNSLPVMPTEAIVAFIREKRQGSRRYFYLVESYRSDDRVRQRVLKYWEPGVLEGANEGSNREGPNAELAAIPV